MVEDPKSFPFVTSPLVTDPKLVLYFFEIFLNSVSNRCPFVSLPFLVMTRVPLSYTIPPTSKGSSETRTTILFFKTSDKNFKS